MVTVAATAATGFAESYETDLAFHAAFGRNRLRLQIL
jgi:hypothetical protein